MYRFTALLLAAVVAAAGCGTGTSGTRPTDTSAGDITNLSSETSQETEGIGEIDPLLVSVSVHVEGWKREAEREAQFQIHRDGLLQLAREAEAAGGILTFELSDVFMEAVEMWHDDVLTQLRAMGHSVAVHADEGGRGTPTMDELRRSLLRKRTQLSELGVETNHVSGICSRGPWVEAALEAGFTSTNGAVAYCATSMDEDLLGDDAGWIAACANPAECHGPVPVSDDRRYHPFHATSSSDWMVSGASAGLLINVSESGGSLACLSEETTGEGGCTAETADLDLLEPIVEEYLAAREPGRVTVLTYSWSIGSVPPKGFGEELTAVFADLVAAGEVVWIGTDDVEGQA